jgi:hypothetical protein
MVDFFLIAEMIIMSYLFILGIIVFLMYINETKWYNKMIKKINPNVEILVFLFFFNLIVFIGLLIVYVLIGQK